MRKYHNKITELDGHKFDSKREAEYYAELKLLQRAGEIESFLLQPKFTLLEGFSKNGHRFRPITYIADFWVFYKDGKQEIIDVKGVETEVFKIKRKLLEHKYPNITLKIVK